MKRSNFSKIAIIVVVMVAALSFLPVGCSRAPDEALFQPSHSLPDYQQESFEGYIRETKIWLEANRVFLTDNTQVEIEANTPFEIYPEELSSPSKGVLLVHGLGDSPFIFRDLAKTLVKEGFIVRTILLPGHGSRPADLTLPEFEDWQGIVEHHVGLLSNAVDEVWLGGFSTGGNLVTSYAAQHDDIKGLLLFSPAIVPRDFLHVMSRFANYFIDWVDFDPHEMNYTRYATLTTNGAALFSRSVSEVNKLISEKAYNRPVLIAISESDSVVNSKAIVEIFRTRFIHPSSRLIWYGGDKVVDPRIINLPTSLPEYRISNFSHMGLLFAPENHYYGKDGIQLICDNGQSEEEEIQCPTDENRWYSSFDYVENGKIHARLTWNPYFEHLERITTMVIGSNE